MSDLKVLFVGCNPSMKNTDPAVPFDGTKSGKTLEEWTIRLGLDKSQVGFMNLTKYATQSQKQLKKKDVNVGQFKFELGLNLLGIYHGMDKALGMTVSKIQSAGNLDPQMLVPNTDAQVKEDLELISKTPLAKIIALGAMAEWGLKEACEGKVPFFKLPHPSGLNRSLNDKEALAKSLEECRVWLYTLPVK